MTESTLFIAALEKGTDEERAAYLEQACSGDESLRRRVEALLRAHAGSDELLDPPQSLGTPAPSALFGERPGSRIGPYKLLEQIGEGGFGVVFMAEQQQPVRRRVALKVLKPGMDSRQVVARFEAERQALALMDHPNIAHVFDGGETDSGRPYFVMELVRGVPITDFCDQNHLPPRARLELFVLVCQAVQHAHQKGIIHRDLKPSNILVTLHDSVPVVKVIDFGIAKATGQQLTDKTLFTNFVQMIGTPMYISPEQAQMSGLDIDTRTDIYALGVLLYELLTGTTPFDRERLRTAAYDELRRIIREEEPPKPSTRLSTLGQAAAIVAGSGQSDLMRLQQLFRGELDWIVMKALEKDRNRRYETASAFAADVQRFLKDEPVQACPPSTWYRFRKLARRNKGAFVTAASLTLAVFVAVVTLAVSNVLIRQEQARTQDEKERAERAQARAQESQKLAEQRAEQIRDGLERLKTANVLLDRSREYAIKLRWDDAHAALTQAVNLRPDHASAWADRADLHVRLGLWEMAADDFAHELEFRPPDAPSRWYMLAVLRRYLGDTEGYRKTLAQVRERFRGTGNVVFLIEQVRTSVLNPGPDAERARGIELAQYAAGFRPKGDWFALYALGLAHYRAGQHEQAVRRLTESLAADPGEWSARTLSFPVLAMAQFRLGQVANAREALQASDRVIDHWTEEMFRRTEDARWVHHLGATAYWPIPWWDWLEARLYNREAKELLDGAPPPDDPRLHVLRARAFAGLRWHDKAEAEYALALKQLAADPQVRLEAHRNRAYGGIQFRLWKRVAAEFDQASAIQPEDMHLAFFSAVAHLVAGETEDFRRACARLVALYDETHNSAIALLALRACALRADALPDPAPLLRLVREVVRPDTAGTIEAAGALYRAGKYQEAVRCLEALGKAYHPHAAFWCFLAMAQQRLGHAQEARAALAQAQRWVAEANQQRLDDPTATRAAWGSWHEPLECRLLLEEAKRLLGEPGA